jgi:hypothetical protein
MGGTFVHPFIGVPTYSINDSLSVWAIRFFLAF